MHINVELHVNDFRLALEFYSTIGFEVIWVREPDGKKGYMVLGLDDECLLFWAGNDFVFEHSYFGRFGPSTPRGVGVEVVIPVNQVEKYYEFVLSTGLEIRQHLELKPWGVKDFRIVDPFGYYLRFTAPYDVRSVSHAVH